MSVSTAIVSPAVTDTTAAALANACARALALQTPPLADADLVRAAPVLLLTRKSQTKTLLNSAHESRQLFEVTSVQNP